MVSCARDFVSRTLRPAPAGVAEAYIGEMSARIVGEVGNEGNGIARSSFENLYGERIEVRYFENIVVFLCAGKLNTRECDPSRTGAVIVRDTGSRCFVYADGGGGIGGSDGGVIYFKRDIDIVVTLLVFSRNGVCLNKELSGSYICRTLAENKVELVVICGSAGKNSVGEADGLACACVCIGEHEGRFAESYIIADITFENNCACFGNNIGGSRGVAVVYLILCINRNGVGSFFNNERAYLEVRNGRVYKRVAVVSLAVLCGYRAVGRSRDIDSNGVCACCRGSGRAAVVLNGYGTDSYLCSNGSAKADSYIVRVAVVNNAVGAVEGKSVNIEILSECIGGEYLGNRCKSGGYLCGFVRNGACIIAGRGRLYDNGAADIAFLVELNACAGSYRYAAYRPLEGVSACGVGIESGNIDRKRFFEHRVAGNSKVTGDLLFVDSK